MKAITVENLSKMYSVATAQDQGVSFREMLTGQMQSFFAKGPKQKPFYALKDISFEVEQGEVLGIIGRNGSGKSTLLKILSKITAPTSGRAIIRGRVASLLEVGTGFHAELTGRENIFMSGIILGMKRWEINKHFDEIVSFAGVEKFLDIPVKKYSSGMRLRLAFSVAAHLQPEILLVDEVLAVGDYEFEKKCLKVLEGISISGRSAFFVSHSMASIRRLCSKVLVLNQGEIQFIGPVEQGIAHYLSAAEQAKGVTLWDENNLPGDDLVKIHEVKTTDSHAKTKQLFSYNEEIHVSVTYTVLKTQEQFSVMLWFHDDYGNLLFSSLDTTNQEWYKKVRAEGVYTSICMIPKYLLGVGKIHITIYIITTGKGWRFSVPESLTFIVGDISENKHIVGDWSWEWPNTAVRPLIEWNVLYKKG